MPEATAAPSVALLVRNGNHARLPPGKESVDSTEFGHWMTKLPDIYLNDPDPPRVRSLDDMFRLILGGKPQKEARALPITAFS